ncbi:hypothetical protein SAY87_028478 [Trapa incisa]|uniref:Uncharacterized protein n=1 Tax=Trapa incisa TaxID=236973 RepID=A0AAN7KXX1_9MYRT|nr:hypothetical protein SAY87_028478 [Trapa incisa]
MREPAEKKLSCIPLIRCFTKVPLTPEMFGGDPCPNVMKKLSVEQAQQDSVRACGRRRLPESSTSCEIAVGGRPVRRHGHVSGSRTPEEEKRSKKKSKKADLEREDEQSVDESDENEAEKSQLGTEPISQGKLELICLYLFTSSGSAIQRRMKQQYDQVVKSNESIGLTLAQVTPLSFVGQFTNCLVEAKNELEHKSEIIHGKFSIAKALLLKLDWSSSNRVPKQIYKLELEKKRLEEDTFVYNWLQRQLKFSPAYKKMLEISACLELKTKLSKLLESEDANLPDISIEELLAQEKKDSFWQKLGKSRTQFG